MADSDFRSETVSLRRIDKKLWQYENCNPSRVEIAVLDYLKEQGWRGYFSEHFNFTQTILCMMCVARYDKFLSGKRKTFPFKHVHDAFCSASDGFWTVDAHELSSDEMIKNAQSFTECDLKKILALCQSRKLKSYIFGKAHLKARCATEISEADLCSYFTASGGRDFFLGFLNNTFPKDRQQILNRAKQAFLKVKRHWEDVGATGRSLMDATDLMGYFLGVHGRAGDIPTINEWIASISCEEDSDAKESLLRVSEEIKDFVERTPKGETTHAALDLTVWRETVASVEVKAPNDRLMDHQKRQLEADKKAGRLSWVINVVEE